VTHLRVDPFHIWLLTGDRSTSAVALDIGYFARAGAAGRHLATANEGTGWWSVLSEQAAVIVLSEGAATNVAAVELVAGLRSETIDPLPANLFRYTAHGDKTTYRLSGKQAE
jgi:hypothetical protein